MDTLANQALFIPGSILTRLWVQKNWDIWKWWAALYTS